MGSLYYDLDYEYLWHPWMKSDRLENNRIMVNGEGCYVTSIEGNKYFDAASGALNVSCGYGQKEIITAMVNQAETLTTTDMMRFSALSPIKLSKKIAELLNFRLTKTFYCTSGSEATETALKIARMYMSHQYGNKRMNIISLKDGYHGSTLVPVSASHTEFTQAGNSLAKGFYSISTPRCSQCLEFKEHDICDFPNAKELIDKIGELGPETVAAFIMEPILGVGGLVIPPENYVKELHSICKKHGILFIFDETMTSFGRTGEWFAFEHFDVVPDILVTGKGICSGYFPLSTISTSEEIFKVFESDQYLGGFRHGHTNSAHPIGCNIALAVIQYMESNSLIENSKLIGKYILDSLSANITSHPFVRNLRGKGLLIAFDLPDVSLSEKLTKECFNQGLIVRQTGSSVGLLPPLIITKEEADTIINILSNVLKNFETNKEEYDYVK